MAALFDVGSGSICGSAGASYIFAFLVRESYKKKGGEIKHKKQGKE
jgi:hypothetical protein